MADFNAAAKKTLKHEGGYTDNANDPGNWTGGKVGQGNLVGTMLGISAPLYAQYLRRTPTVADMKAITPKIATDLYKKLFWDVIEAYRFSNQKLAEIYFDFAINSGNSRAIKMMQYIANQTAFSGMMVDGVLGPQTRSAFTQMNQDKTFTWFVKLRTWFYQYLVPGKADEDYGFGKVPDMVRSFFSSNLRIGPSARNATFFNGWLNRINYYRQYIVGSVSILALVGFFLPLNF